MEQQLSKNVVVIHNMNAVAAGTTNQTGAAVDTQGFDGVMFIADIGALTATQVTSLKAQDGLTSGGAYNDIAGSNTSAMADGDSNKLLVVDIYKPQLRFLKPVVLRATANAVINCVIAILYKGLKGPVVNDATLSQIRSLVSPADGTA